MFKKKGTIYLIIVALVVLLVLTSCDPREGALNANLQPYISITNYFGVDSDTLITQSYLFQQTVQWSGSDDDGNVVGYAFRVLNEDGEPIETPGYDVLDEDGWVKFYTPSANQDIPLDESAETTIWIDQSYATINFPAADANGDSTNVISLFEVKCKDNREDESEVARKYFQAHSNTPRALIDMNIPGETISTAIIFKFMMQDDDPFVGEAPYYFDYKLERRDLNGTLITESEGGYADEWLSTLDLPEVTLALHSALNGNALIPNTLAGDVPQDSTFLRVKAYDNALIVSDELEISFVVKEGFYPGTLIYYGDGNPNANGIYALGTNHFATYLDDGLSDILPSVQTSDGAHHATSFWYNSEEKYTAIGSNDFKTYMRWGYSGEFEDNNPQKPADGITLDEVTGQPYFCEIVGYDLRLDGEPYYYPPIPAVGVHLQVDDDGKEWLRVGANYFIGQSTTITLTSYSGSLDNMYGEHTFEVRAIDLQGAVDETPHEFTYTVVAPIPKEEKSGVLIIDDDGDTPNSPSLLINEFYEYIVSDYDIEPGYINREDMNALGMDGLHHGKSVIATSDIQQYKAIIYHADNPTAEFSFWKEFEALKIYLLQGGNIILSGGSNLKIMNQKCTDNAFSILDQYFGIPMDNEDAIGIVPSSVPFLFNQFFIDAIGQGSFTNIDLLLPSFNNAVNLGNGLQPVAYFNDYQPEAEVIFTYGCRVVDANDPYAPSQEQYNQYSDDLPVGLRKVTEDNSCYIFGFPLAYMESDQVKSAMTQILNELP
jgi:hypothetical protein